MTTQKSLLSNTVWNTLGSIVYFACQWLITLIVVWLYDDYTNAGNLALAMTVTNIFYCIAIYNLRAYQVSDVLGEYSDREYVIARLVTCIGAITLCAVFVLASGYPHEQVYIILCYMGFRSVEAFIDVLHGIAHKCLRLDLAGISMIVRGLLMLAAFYVLGWAFELLPAVIGMVFVTALFGLLFDFPNAKKLAAWEKFSLQRIWGLLKRAFPLMLVILMITFFASYTRYSLERIHGTEALGAFATATTPAVAVQLAVSFLLAPLMNLFSDCIKDSNRARFYKIFAISCAMIIGLTLIAVIAAHIAGQWGLRLLFGEDILPYTYLLSGAMMATGLTASLWFMNVVFTTVRDIRGLFFGFVIGVAACIAAAEVFLREFGLVGANYTMIACQAVAFLVLCVRFPRYVKTRGVFAEK